MGMCVSDGARLISNDRYPESPKSFHNVVNGILYVRRFFLRHFALPRPDFYRNHWIEAKPKDQSGRYFLFDYLAHPWYIKPSFLRRWGPRAWITRLLGYKVPGDDGDKYFPQGYALAEIGPQFLSGKGIDEMNKTQVRLNRLDRGGCPFTSK